MVNKNILIILGVVLVVSFSGGVLGANIYVDQTLISDCISSDYSITNRDCVGSDGNAYKTIQAGLDVMNTGDTLILRGGEYDINSGGAGWTGHLSLPTNINGDSWEAGHFNTVMSYPGEWAIVDGQNLCGDTGDGNQPRGVFGGGDWGSEYINYWKFERLEIKNGADSASHTYAAGLQIHNGPFWVRYCYIHDNLAWPGENPAGIRGYHWEDSIVEYCYFKDNGAISGYNDNHAHIQIFSDYEIDSIAQNGFPGASHNCIKRNMWRYNLFEGGVVGIKHKGHQGFTGRNPGGGHGFDDTYKTYGDKIHHNIFKNLNWAAIHAHQDFCQIYNNILDSCGGLNAAGWAVRLYKVITYNNLMTNCGTSEGELVPLFREMYKWYAWEETDYYGYDYNNIIDQGFDIWFGSEFSLGKDWANELPTFTNYFNKDNYFYRPETNADDSDGTRVISVTGDDGRTRYTASAYEAAFPGSNVYYNTYNAGDLLFQGTSGADKYKTRSAHVIEGAVTPANGGIGGPHPYLSGVTIPSYVGATNPNDNAWVGGVLNDLANTNWLKSQTGDPSWIEGYVVSDTCSEKGGVDCCTGGETCDGTSYGTASDCTGICCSVICTPPQTCTDAGGTCQTNTCSTYTDCTSLTGTCATGYCCLGTCTTSSTCGAADNNPVDGVVSIIELMNYIGEWKAGSVTITELMTGIGEWKNGC